MIWGKKSALKAELTQKQSLPIGVAEFHYWSDRVINGAMLAATPESQKFALAAMLLDLPPTVAFESDAFFISKLRKGAVNQVAQQVMSDIKLAREREKQKLAEATAPLGADGQKVLENGPLCGAQ